MAKQPVTAELFYSGEWNTAPAYTRDEIRITRGKGDEHGEAAPSNSIATLDNRDLAYNPRNPSSALYGLIGRNTPTRFRLATPDQDVTDTFSRTLSNSWGSADSGQAYSLATVGGAAADFDVAAGVGTMVVDGANEYRIAWLPGVEAVNGEALLGPVDLPTAAVTGGALEPGNIAARMQDVNTYYLFRVAYGTDESLRARIYDPGGVQLVDGLAYASAQWTPGEDIMVRAVWDGPVLKMRVWPASVAEPTPWHAEATDHTYLGPGGVGVRSGAAASNSNVPATFGYSALTVSTWDVRATGEMASWKPRQTEDFALGADRGDAWTEITATGVLRRLGQGNPPAWSALRRTIHASDPVLYWPLEDEQNATQGAAAAGGTPMRQTFGDAQFPFGAEGPPGGGSTVDTTGDGVTVLGINASVTSPLGASHNQWMLQFVQRAETTFTPSAVTYLLLYTNSRQLLWYPRLLASGNFGLRIFDWVAFAEVTTLDSGISVLDSLWHHGAVYVRKSGSDLAVKLYLDGVQVATTTLTGYGIGAFNSVSLSSGGVANKPRIGHIYLTESVSTSDGALTVDPNHVAAVYGHAGETAGDRLDRLCTEAGVPFQLHGEAADTAPMGAQPVGALPDLLAECERTDAGLMYEPRNSLGVAYRTRSSLYNQSPALTLSTTDEQITSPLDPDIDDLYVRNDITVKRANGSTYQAVQETGPLNVQDPTDDPQGVSRRLSQVDINPSTDAALSDHATWRLHLGTVDETRYPRLTVNFGSPGITPAHEVALGSIDIGDLIFVDDLEADQVMLMVLGYTETIGSHWRTITFNCAPARPWEIFTLDDDRLGRLASDGTVLNNGQTDTGTNLDLDTPSGPLWSITDEPWDFLVAGERVTVTTNNDATNTQNVTVSRSVNGVVKAQNAGAVVDLWRPGVLGL